MNIFIEIIGIILISTVGYLIYLDKSALKSLKAILTDKESTKLTNERYFELKHRIQFHNSVSAIVLFALGFFGFRSFHEVKRELDDQINHYKCTLVDYDTTVTKHKLALTNYDTALSNTMQEAERLRTELTILQNKFAPSIISYLVRDIEIKADAEKKQRIHFKNLKTINGRSLPEFKEAPVLNVLNNRSNRVTILKSTDDYFEIVLLNFLASEEAYVEPSGTFDLMVTVGR